MIKLIKVLNIIKLKYNCVYFSGESGSLAKVR